MSEWQDISTAPKDGTPILIWDPSKDGSQSLFHYETGERVQFDDRRYSIGYWRVFYGEKEERWGKMWGNRNDSEVHPTHWMPLPAPPQQEGQP